MRILLLVLMSLTATTVMAKSPWYVGGGVGMTLYTNDSGLDEITEDAVDVDSWEGGFQLLGGYQLGTKWAIEAGYIDFGQTKDFDPDALAGTGAELVYESTGIYLNGQYHIPLSSIFSIDLSGGWLFGEADAKITDLEGASDSYKDNGVMLGVAVTWQANESLYLRLPINYFAIDYDSTVKKPVRIGLDLIWNF